ncbi:MAG: ATP-binding protein [Candidatus Hydrogenedentes bacterium]|nr:ATP-binding protein [Candidatus Hydrogenedentota bacterium]
MWRRRDISGGTDGSMQSVRWYNSLIFRVIVLCVVLVVCMFGSVSVLTRYYFRQVVTGMEERTQDIVQRLEFNVEQNPNANLHDLEQNLGESYNDASIELREPKEPVEVTAFTLEKDERGRFTMVTHKSVTIGGKPMCLLTVRVTVVPQTEIVRAFKNKYFAMLTLVFVVTLCLMIYFIARILHPLSDLAESCAQIRSGHLTDVGTGRNVGEVLALEQTFNSMVASLREKETVETNLRQAQRLSAIGTLAAGVAHDIRNPLNSIKLLSSHAMDQLGGVSDAAPAVKQLQTIRSEVNRLQDIVSGFLSLAKEGELRVEPYRIDAVLEECARLIRKDAEARGIRLITELRAGDLVLVIDPKQLKRAILNVLINAMDACPQGGRVRLFSRVMEKHCEVEVRDDGAGIPKEVVERVFDPYFTTKATGTGLGLSITRGIVEEHGGTIALSSLPEQGCQVVMTFPIQRTPDIKVKDV